LVCAAQLVRKASRGLPAHRVHLAHRATRVRKAWLVHVEEQV